MIHGEPLSCVRQPGRLPVFIDTNHYQPRPAEFKGYEAGAHNVLLILSLWQGSQDLMCLFLHCPAPHKGAKIPSVFATAFPVFLETQIDNLKPPLRKGSAEVQVEAGENGSP